MGEWVEMNANNSSIRSNRIKQIWKEKERNEHTQCKPFRFSVRSSCNVRNRCARRAWQTIRDRSVDRLVNAPASCFASAC